MRCATVCVCVCVCDTATLATYWPMQQQLAAGGWWKQSNKQTNNQSEPMLLMNSWQWRIANGKLRIANCELILSECCQWQAPFHFGHSTTCVTYTNSCHSSSNNCQIGPQIDCIRRWHFFHSASGQHVVRCQNLLHFLLCNCCLARHKQRLC